MPKPLDYDPKGMATAIGSMPHTDPVEACMVMREYLKDIPAWPQLPKRSFLENMYVQFSESFPGIEVVPEEERIYVDRSRDLDETLARLYVAYLEKQVDAYAIGADYAAGLHAFLRTQSSDVVAVKGQITGPVSWGLTVTDEQRRPVLYDDILADALAKHLRLKAAWQQNRLRILHHDTIVFVDEPYMSAFGSAFVSLSRQQVLTLLEEVFAGIPGTAGIHCCANTDWSLLLETSVNILSLDAFDFAETIALYPVEVKNFLGRGGCIAWGIVPTEEGTLARETTQSLVARLEEGMGLLDRKGVPFDLLMDRALITPACGLASLSPEAAERALELTVQVSTEMRSRFA